MDLISPMTSCYKNSTMVQLVELNQCILGKFLALKEHGNLPSNNIWNQRTNWTNFFHLSKTPNTGILRSFPCFVPFIVNRFKSNSFGSDSAISFCRTAFVMVARKAKKAVRSCLGALKSLGSNFSPVEQQTSDFAHPISILNHHVCYVIASD